MSLEDILKLLPDNKKAVVILSGGLDSTIALRLAIEKYGKENVAAITFDYRQKQSVEIDCAYKTCEKLDIKWEVIDTGFLAKISQGFSANVDNDIPVPSIKQVLGDPQPKTYVPNRNMILLSIAAAFAEVGGYDTIICGLQIHDLYGYFDTSQRFIDKLNLVLDENRKHKIQILSPFSNLSKLQELQLLQEMDGNIELTKSTYTCYKGASGLDQCGVCPSCAERIMNFAKFGCKDPVPYLIPVDWNQLIEKNKCVQS